MIISGVFAALLIIIRPVMVIAQPIENNGQLGLRSAIDKNQLVARAGERLRQSPGAGPSSGGDGGDPKAGGRGRAIPPTSLALGT